MSYCSLPLNLTAQIVVAQFAVLKSTTNKAGLIEVTPQITPLKLTIDELRLKRVCPIKYGLLEVAPEKNGTVNMNSAQLTICKLTLDPDRILQIAS